jgi:hypothetical protein
MNLFEFTPNETGYDSFFVMSDTLENALTALCKLENFDMSFWAKYKHKYTVNIYGANDPTWSDNC